MTLRDYVRVLRTGWRLLLALTVLGVALSAALTLARTPMYEGSAQLFVSASQPEGGTVTGLQQGSQFAQQRVKSYADIVNSRRVTEPVIARLELALTPAQLAARITATATVDTVLMRVAVRDPSPVDAQRIAQAVALRFTEVATALETPLGGSTSPVKVSVVRDAELPTAPVSPRKGLDIGLGLLVGLALGAGISVLREALDGSIKSSDVIEEVLSLPTVGVIGYDADSAKQPLIVHDDPRSPRAEAFRQLRTNLQFLDVDHPPRSIVLTSSLPSEGKSTTACNLALALTQAGVRVILVDGDLRRPRVASYLGIEGAVGLTDVLAGRADADDVLQPWGDGRLMVLPSGPTPPNPSELLGSTQMTTLMAELESRADLVLVDAPPLLPVTDSSVLASVCDGVILVVRSGRTTREQAARAVETLRRVDANTYGVVLNMAPSKGPDAYAYGYGYAPEPVRQARHRRVDIPAQKARIAELAGPRR